ncbi:MAG: DUF4150 domain-containing protein [Deltaproteobacteria bacterium]|nr:DUF4150 domain-containing protein [Deltaproteobacteria bacterium]
MYANNQKGGIDAAFADVCLTPIAAAPVPVAYPNRASGAMAVGAAHAVLFGGAPAHHLGTVVPMTTGDAPGVAGGVTSGTVMGPSRHVTAATTCLVGGMPATRLGSATLQNGTNCGGARVAPSQLKVLLLSR